MGVKQQDLKSACQRWDQKLLRVCSGNAVEDCLFCTVLCCAVLCYTWVNLLNSLVGQAKKSERDSTNPHAEKSWVRTAV